MTANNWKSPGAVVLISCYELGHQPIALASPMGFLRRAGYGPTALDIAVEPFSPEATSTALFVGISVPMHTAMRIGIQTVRRIREVNPGCHICFYGLYAHLNSVYLLENGADSVIGGEYEGALVDLIESLAASREPSGIRGVGTGSRPSDPLLEKLPLAPPARENLPDLRFYAHLSKAGEMLPVGTVEASRGCKHLCLHCPIPPVYGGRFFVVPEKIVIEDIRRLAASGARHITFADPDFLNGPSHAMRVARALHREFPQLTFDFTAKVEHLVKHEKLLPELHGLGCIFIVSAVESLSETVLNNLDKGHTSSDVARAVRAAHDAGISIRPSLVSFTPWTTAEDYFEVLDFVEENNLIDEVDPVQYAIRLLVPPGSDLIGRPEMENHLGELDEENFIYRWNHPDPAMDRLHDAVLSLAEEAAEKEEDPALTFQRIRETAAGVLGQPGRTGAPVALAPDRIKPPRLTESWFC